MFNCSGNTVAIDEIMEHGKARGSLGIDDERHAAEGDGGIVVLRDIRHGYGHISVSKHVLVEGVVGVGHRVLGASDVVELHPVEGVEALQMAMLRHLGWPMYLDIISVIITVILGDRPEKLKNKERRTALVMRN